MTLADQRRRLPVVDALPRGGNRWAIWELTLACDQKCMPTAARGPGSAARTS
jgi:hypothetical protein